MYPHTPSSTAELAALRVRLYRPDPPEDAVEAYLAALRDEAPGPAIDVPKAMDRPRRLGRGVTALVTAVVLAVGLGAAMTVSRQAAATGATSGMGIPQLALPPVPGTPIGTLYGPGSTTGLFDATGSRAVVSVDCSGRGTVRVRIADEPPTVLTCEPGGPALAMLPSRGALDRFTVEVSRHGSVRWSLVVGAVDLASA